LAARPDAAAAEGGSNGAAREALALWRSDPLPELVGEPFAPRRSTDSRSCGCARPSSRSTRTSQDVYRRLDAAAPAVPLVNRRTVVLVSKRVGNYQHHSLWGPLLDQLWVR
jgi:hypothetical protein